MENKKWPHHLMAGGIAGISDAIVCHPLDTIKTRIQINPKNTNIFKTGNKILQKEGFFAFYKGLTAVTLGIGPKLSLRFFSFESYKRKLNAQDNMYKIFGAGVMSGVTESICIVTPIDVCKIRIQSQFSSLYEPNKKLKYKNVFQTAATIVKEEGPFALYKGIIPTILRQSINQGVNFTTYHFLKKNLMEYTNKKELSSWQHLLLGGISGGLGPIANGPIDVIKTRIQRQVIVPGIEPKYKGIVQGIILLQKEEGTRAMWKGLSSRLIRIIPGQAITFMVYEKVLKFLSTSQ
jgi:solute carrier family 25 citrate transporter 1